MNLKELLEQSLMKDGKPSSSRIIAYSIQISIMLFSVTAIGIELSNAIFRWKTNEIYIIPWEHIVIFSMFLTFLEQRLKIIFIK